MLPDSRSEEADAEVMLRSVGRTGLAVAVTVTALAAAGCDGGDEAEGNGGGGPSKDEFVEQANPICERHNEKVTAAASRLLAGGQLPKPDEFGRLAKETIIPEYSAQVAELRKVKPPAESAAAYTMWLDESQSLLGRIPKDPSMIIDGEHFESVNEQADSLGLSQDCHAGPS